MLRGSTQVEEEYGDYFQDTEIETRPGPTPRAPAAEFEQKEPTGCAPSLPLSGVGYSSAKMIYDFEGAIEDNHCTDRFGNNNEPMYARCEEFCGGDAVPLLIGTGGSPVGLDTAREVCFHESIVGSSPDENFCRGVGQSAIRELKAQLSEFVSLIMIFRT